MKMTRKYYALRSDLGYIESVSMAGKIKMANKLNKDILTENKEYLQKIAELLNSSRENKDVEVVEISLVESLAK